MERLTRILGLLPVYTSPYISDYFSQYDLGKVQPEIFYINLISGSVKISEFSCLILDVQLKHTYMFIRYNKMCNKGTFYALDGSELQHFGNSSLSFDIIYTAKIHITKMKRKEDTGM